MFDKKEYQKEYRRLHQDKISRKEIIKYREKRELLNLSEGLEANFDRRKFNQRGHAVHEKPMTEAQRKEWINYINEKY